MARARQLPPVNEEVYELFRRDEAAHEQFRRDVEFVNSNWRLLLNKYHDRYVMVHKGEVVAVDESLDSALEELDRRGIPRHHTVRWFDSKKPRIMVL